MKIALSSVGFLLVLAAAPAAMIYTNATPDGKAGIDLIAPSECSPGQLVELDARQSEVEALLWTIVPETSNFKVADDTKRAFFSAPTFGEFLIFVSGAKDNQPVHLVHKLQVQRAVQDVLIFPLPEYPGVKEDAIKVAQVFLTVAEAGLPPDKMLPAAASAITEALGPKLSRWMDFLDAVGAYIDAQIASGDLKTPEQYRELWKKIAEVIK